MAKKRSFNQMRLFAQQLPVQFQEGKMLMRGDALTAKKPEATGEDGKPLDPDKFYEVPISQGVNHYRRIKRLFKAKGYGGVKQYAEEVVALHEISIMQHQNFMAAMPTMPQF